MSDGLGVGPLRVGYLPVAEGDAEGDGKGAADPTLATGGATGGGGLLGPIPDARLIGAGGDDQGVILLYSHQIVRLAALPSRAAIAKRPGFKLGATIGADTPATDAAFLRKLSEAFEAYEAARDELSAMRGQLEEANHTVMRAEELEQRPFDEEDRLALL